MQPCDATPHTQSLLFQMASTLIAIFGFNGYEAPRNSVDPCQARPPLLRFRLAGRRAARLLHGCWPPDAVLPPHRIPHLPICPPRCPPAAPAVLHTVQRRRPPLLVQQGGADRRHRVRLHCLGCVLFALFLWFCASYYLKGRSRRWPSPQTRHRVRAVAFTVAFIPRLCPSLHPKGRHASAQRWHATGRHSWKYAA